MQCPPRSGDATTCATRPSRASRSLRAAARRPGERMNARRKILNALGAGVLGTALPLLAQQPRAKRIAFFAASNEQATTSSLAAFREGMAELGWSEGRDYVIEARYVQGDLKAASAMAAEI